MRDYSKSLVGVVDITCFAEYFGFGGRSFAIAEALSPRAATIPPSSNIKSSGVSMTAHSAADAAAAAAAAATRTSRIHNRKNALPPVP
jgi:hypothetical protein